ncbi:sulfur carrier protein ThiS [Gandjariella thermophila]|uniref:Thiamine biosynthesis protein ThiS n=1 Tax=Gandjariella thermophila TaxID=1931992 RepID=A0A4D4J6V7_9PSEU|nr:sulfur carrier protein ThiS [Gandjariella thermophila]GDY30246.1 thiamine biosynthesis protein ThiS [Gandjariella thermophila]
MIVRVNGEAQEWAEGTTVDEIVRRLGAPPSGVAVAMDGEVVPRATWEATAVRDGAVVEVLTAVQGG